MTVYGVSMITLYGASTVYHWARAVPRKVMVLKKIDHIAIYLLIAGSYTPVFYYGLEGAWRAAMLISIWVLTLVGILLKVWFINLPRYVSTAFYIALGWIAVIPFAKLLTSLPAGALVLMFIGGVAYTIGAVIYATKWLNFFPDRFGFHEIFHIFITLGSVAHFTMIMIYIMPL